MKYYRAKSISCSLSALPRSHWRIAILVGIGHILLFLLVIYFSSTSSKEETKKFETIQASLVILPPTTQKTPNLQKRNRPTNNQKAVKTPRELPPKKPIKNVPSPRKKLRKQQQRKAIKTKIKPTGGIKKTAKRYRTPQEIREKNRPSTNHKDRQSSRITQLKKRLEQQIAQQIQQENVRVHADPETNFSSYNQQIVQALVSSWTQPRETEIDNHSTYVIIRLTIHRSGKILKKNIVTKSNNQAMNISVEQLLRHLQVFPPFPREMHPQTISKNFTMSVHRQAEYQ